jgi:cyclopropane fatty-acyl-phospholipid synthase-like methyltransferase
MHYDPSVYLNIDTPLDAVNIILTPEGGMSSEQRWQQETPILIELIKRHLKTNSSVLDFGCGIGRLASPLINQMRCTVVGVDISPAMRAIAAGVLNSDLFCALPPMMVDLVCRLESFDMALSVWFLQHVANPWYEIGLMRRYLKKDGLLFMVNNVGRVVPMDTGQWINDGIDIEGLLINHNFELVERGNLDPSIAPGWMQDGTFWAVYRKA